MISLSKVNLSLSHDSISGEMNSSTIGSPNTLTLKGVILDTIAYILRYILLSFNKNGNLRTLVTVLLSNYLNFERSENNDFGSPSSTS